VKGTGQAIEASLFSMLVQFADYAFQLFKLLSSFAELTFRG
jgi:hypothetical protein